MNRPSGDFLLYYPNMANDSVILRFSGATFEFGQHGHGKSILEDASFSVRTGSRITLMGQNGAGKSTLFKLITGEEHLDEGDIFLTPKDATVAVGRQVMQQEMSQLTVRDYFATAFTE